MTATVVFVGCCGTGPRTDAGTVERWAPSDVFRKSVDGVRVLVIGRDALLQLDPREVRVALGRAIDRAILCVAQCDATTIARWIGAGFRHVVHPDALSAEVRSVFAKRPCPRASPDRWLPDAPVPTDEAGRVLSLLPTLQSWSVGWWANAASCSPRALFSVISRWCGLSPHEVLTRYRVFVALELRLQGASVEDCAAAAGYSEASALLRACRRIRSEMPRVRNRRARPTTTSESVNRSTRSGHSRDVAVVLSIDPPFQSV